MSLLEIRATPTGTQMICEESDKVGTRLVRNYWPGLTYGALYDDPQAGVMLSNLMGNDRRPPTSASANAVPLPLEDAESSRVNDAKKMLFQDERNWKATR